MPVTRRLVTAGLMATALARLVTGQQPSQPPQAQEPTFRGAVNFVRVDVTVTDGKGKPVSDLKATDFEVTEAGKLQKIETFKLVSLDGGLMPSPGRDDGPPRPIRSDDDERREAARDDVRLFGIFLDDYHVKRGSSMSMREQIARFVETQLGPSDLVGLMYPLDAIGQVTMTRNHDAIRRAILQFEGRKHVYFPKTPGEASCVFRLLEARQVAEVERLRNLISFGAIKSFIMRLGSLKEGRKALILVSEGYSNGLPGELVTYAGGLGPVSLLVPPSPPPSECVGVRGDLNMDLLEIDNLANRNNVAIYTVDPRGLALNEYGMELPEVGRETDKRFLNATMDTLRALAEDSDGRAIVMRNELTLAMKQIVVDSSSYYLLGYNSSMAVADGKFHPIKVKVKRSGVEVRHRPGYWAFRPEDAVRVTTAAPAVVPSAVEAALAATSVPRSRIVRTWMGNERGMNGSTRVTFAWEPAPRGTTLPGEPVNANDRPVRVAVMVSTADGSPYFRGYAGSSSAAQNLAGAQVSFEAPPGRARLRISVEGAGGEVLDSETRELDVPDLTSPQTLFGTPQVFRARTAVELQRLKTEPQPLPSATREFSRSERLLLRVPMYGPVGSSPRLVAELQSRTGQRMVDVPVSPPQAGRAAHELEFALSSLSPGEYGIVLTASAASVEARDIVAFRVTP